MSDCEKATLVGNVSLRKAHSMRVLAVVAHPDDIEFIMAGTLLLLQKAGWEVHFLNVANGCCGSMHLSRELIAEVRLKEAKQSAALVPATHHAPICDDLAVFYDRSTLAKVASVVRQVNPQIVLTHAPWDYMEDHQNTCRLAITAAFSKNMPNFMTEPPIHATTGDVAVYHAQPHGNMTPFGDFVVPQFAIDVGSVIESKLEMLACHQSQQSWLDETQKMSSYTQSMLDLGKEVASLVGANGYAEGWRQRNPLGFGPEQWNPLRDALHAYVLDPVAPPLSH